MDKDKKEWEKKVKSAYAPPRVEVYAAEAGTILAGTNGNTGGSAGGAFEDGVITGAKALDISFTDVWEDYEYDDQRLSD